MESLSDIEVKALQKVKEINSYLDDVNPLKKDVGLLSGNMGRALYYYALSGSTFSSCLTEDYLKKAKNLVEDVYAQLGNDLVKTHFADGLAGIAYSINYLIQTNIETGDIDDVLEDVDDAIFKYIVHSQKLSINLEDGVLGYLAYVLPRIKNEGIGQSYNKDSIFKRLIIFLVNRLGELIEDDELWYKEPLLFDVTWNLPMCLRLLSKIRKFDVYSRKIDHLLDCIFEKVLSIYPRLQSNRLGLVISIEEVISIVKRPTWEQHAARLKEDIDIDFIINDELKDKNIQVFNGVSGVYWLLRTYSTLPSQQNFFKINQHAFIERIVHSSYWNVDDTPKYRKDLLKGLSGIAYVLIDAIDSSHER